MANIMADNGGLKVMLDRLEHVEDSIHSKQLLMVLLKLLGYCVKVKKNREKLLDPELKTIPILLKGVKLCLAASETSAIGLQGSLLGEQVLQIMEKLLVDATTKQVIYFHLFLSSSKCWMKSVAWAHGQFWGTVLSYAT